MKLGEIMSRSVAVVGPTSTISEATERMSRLNVGTMPVVHYGQLLGVITVSDLSHISAKGLDPLEARVSDVMTGTIHACSEELDVGEAAEMMQREKVARLFVLDKRGNLSGVVSLGDLARIRPKAGG
jgi:CBS domain-containing protein